MRVLLAGILGGLAFFLWGAVAHMFLGLGSVGMQDVPNEQAIMDAVHGNITQPGLYIFPGMHLPPNATFAQKGEAMDEAMKEAATNPTGIMVVHPNGDPGMTRGRLMTELGNNILISLIAAFLLTKVNARNYWKRVGFVSQVGVLAALTTNVSYWNWYGFPANYTIAYMFTEVVAFLVMGLVAARIIKGGAQVSSAAA